MKLQSRNIRRGMSLLELLIALAVTAVTGAAASAIVVAVTRSLTSITAGRSATQRAHLVQTRLRSVSDTSLACLALDAKQGLAFWTSDDNADGRVNILELCVIWTDADTGLLTEERVKFPDAWSQEWVTANNLVLSTSDDFFQAMLQQRRLGYTVTKAVGQRMTVSEMWSNAQPVREATRVRVRATLTDDTDSTSEVLACMGFPNHKSAQ